MVVLIFWWKIRLIMIKQHLQNYYEILTYFEILINNKCYIEQTTMDNLKKELSIVQNNFLNYGTTKDEQLLKVIENNIKKIKNIFNEIYSKYDIKGLKEL